MRSQAQVLLKRSCTLGKLVNTQTKGITLLCIGKNNMCISCVLMALSIYKNNLFKCVFFKFYLCYVIIIRDPSINIMTLLY